MSKHSFLQIDSHQIETLKNKWIQELLAQNVVVEWVTRSDRPIPSAGLLLRKRIILFCLIIMNMVSAAYVPNRAASCSNGLFSIAPVDEAQVQKAEVIRSICYGYFRSLRLNLTGPKLLDNRLAMMKTSHGKSVVQIYNEQELKELKMK